MNKYTLTVFITALSLSGAAFAVGGAKGTSGAGVTGNANASGATTTMDKASTSPGAPSNDAAGAPADANHMDVDSTTHLKSQTNTTNNGISTTNKMKRHSSRATSKTGINHSDGAAANPSDSSTAGGTAGSAGVSGATTH